MSVNIPGLIVMLLFYLLVLGTGIWASRKSKRATEKRNENWRDVTLLGNRGITLAVGVFTTAATYVGGGFLVGISERVYTPNMGLVWSIVPVAAVMAFIVGGLFYAKKMRQRKYVTMMDPIQRQFGKAVSGVLSVALVLSDIFWVAVGLIGLGTTISVILDLSYSLCIWLSAAVAITYTLFGGLYSVAYTDVLQLVLTFVSLWLCVPFVLTSEHSLDITKTALNFTYQTPWIGSIDTDSVWKWLDEVLSLGLYFLGSQEFHQRTLSAFSPTTAKLSCFIAVPVILMLAVPPVLIGATGASTDWNQTSYGSPSPYERDQASYILPLVLQHLTPIYVSVIGIGAVGAAVMSSTDSVLLSAASIFSSNIYKNILRTSASEREMQWVVRITVVLVGLIASLLTLLSNSVMVFWIVGADITYVFTFPALTCALYCKFSNGYGSIMGVFIALLLRVLSGEPEFGLPAVLQYPGGTFKDGMYIQRAPISTICMLSNLFATIVFSYLASVLFNRGILPQSWDILGAKTHKTSQELASTDNCKTNDVDAEKIREAEAEHMMETSPLETSVTMAVNVPGLIVMLVFYMLVLATGIWASRKSKRDTKNSSADWTDITLLGNRGINLLVGACTTTATYVGGAFIVGNSEVVYNPNMGLAWNVMPLAATVAFTIGGVFYATKMRQRKYVTMMDPIQEQFGKGMSGVLSAALVLSDVFWVTTTLTGLGATMSIILDLSYSICVWIAAVVAITYTLLGGLYSVAYTDVVQLTLTFVSLWLCVPFVLTSEHSLDIITTATNFTYQNPWLGSVDTDRVWKWLDNSLLLSLSILGCQEFHQRTLSAMSPATARLSCFIAAPLMIVFAIPSVLIGATAASADWNQTTYGSPSPYERDQASHILPLVLQHLTPSYVSVIGIGAVGAAVMSSTDSALLSAASIFSSNIYKDILRTSASEREMQWVVRITVMLVGVIGSLFTLLSNSVMVFWIVGADITYVFTFPALTCALYCKFSNGYGSIMGVFIALVLRVLSGEPEFGLPAVLQYPGGTFKDGMYIQRAPISTICMLSNLFATIVFSYLASVLFNRGILPQRWDILAIKNRQTSQELASTDNCKTNHVEKIREAEAEHMMETSPLQTSAL
ncbi:uncharacterized protein ACB057_009951 [Neosynchiropus ocellatus]